MSVAEGTLDLTALVPFGVVALVYRLVIFTTYYQPDDDAL
jgi:hypothetical protein